MARMELIGAFGLTEPEHGSDISAGLATSARRDGDEWVLNGEKKWIGNAAFADLVVIWARDEEDEQVKGFVVEKGTEGMTFDKQEDKIALRVVQNAEIHLADVRVPEANRLQRAESFRSTADVLRVTRMSVAWQATGCARGAFEHALRYTKARQQFGRPIASFQMVQDLLVKMLSNVTASTAMNVRASQLQDAGLLKDEHASLCKAHATVRMREAVGWAREVLGGNGILLEHHVGRFVADAEAIYSYEGTREMNTLIVGRAITGEARVRLRSRAGDQPRHVHHQLALVVGGGQVDGREDPPVVEVLGVAEDLLHLPGALGPLDQSIRGPRASGPVSIESCSAK